MKNRIFLLSLISLAMATWLLYHLISIWIYGSFFIYESNKTVLALETVTVGGSFIYAFVCAFKQFVDNVDSEIQTDLNLESTSADQILNQPNNEADDTLESELNAEHEPALR